MPVAHWWSIIHGSPMRFSVPGCWGKKCHFILNCTFVKPIQPCSDYKVNIKLYNSKSECPIRQDAILCASLLVAVLYSRYSISYMMLLLFNDKKLKKNNSQPQVSIHLFGSDLVCCYRQVYMKKVTQCKMFIGWLIEALKTDYIMLMKGLLFPPASPCLLPFFS